LAQAHTAKKTAIFIVTAVKTSNVTHILMRFISFYLET
jgi:hypothetical protein